MQDGPSVSSWLALVAPLLLALPLPPAAGAPGTLRGIAATAPAAQAPGGGENEGSGRRGGEGEPAGDATSRFESVLESYDAWRLTSYPEYALRRGVKDRAGELTDNSLSGIHRRQAEMGHFLEELRAIPATELSERDRRDHALLVRELALSADGFRFNGWMMPVGGRWGPHTEISQLGETATILTLADAEAYLKRVAGAPGLLVNATEVMQAGLDAGVVPPKVTVLSTADQIGAVRRSLGDLLRKPLRALPPSIPESERARLLAELGRLLDPLDTMLTSFEAFFRDEYFPRCRDTIGARDMADGDLWYAHELKVHTTTARTAREIHDTGLAEVARIRAEMMEVIARTDWAAADPARLALPEDGRFAAFIAFLRSDARFYCTSAEELLARYRDVCKRIDPKLPALFGRLPRLTYGVREIPRFMAPTQTTAYYQPGSPDLGEPGYFYANTYALDQRPTYEFIPLSLHEAVPGHHFQIALAQELEGVRPFRRDLDSTAFTEGWALYAERLGIEMGFFEDPYDDFGRLLYEMWRSCRLVVDTGMHAFGWSRADAIAFMTRNTALSDINIANEVDRYIGWPGQACGYKIGELVIRRLRGDAERALGANFDLRRFHDAVLLDGPLPLDVLEENIARWIDGEIRRTAPQG